MVSLSRRILREGGSALQVAKARLFGKPQRRHYMTEPKAVPTQDLAVTLR